MLGKRTHRFVLVLLGQATLLAAEEEHGHDRAAIGSCSYEILVHASAANLRPLRADLLVLLQLPAGSGLVHVPVPLSCDGSSCVAVDPGSSHNLVLSGFLRPEHQFGVIVAVLSDKPSSLVVCVRDVYLPVEPSGPADHRRGAMFLLARASSAIRNALGPVRMPAFEEITIRGVTVHQTNPIAGCVERSGSYRIRLPAPAPWEGDITILYEAPADQTILYYVLAAMGILLGYAGAHWVIRSASRAWVCILLAVLGLAATVTVFLWFLSPVQRTADPTCIVTTGMVLGLLAGLLLKAAGVLANVRGRNGTGAAPASPPA